MRCRRRVGIECLPIKTKLRNIESCMLWELVRVFSQSLATVRIAQKGKLALGSNTWRWNSALVLSSGTNELHVFQERMDEASDKPQIPNLNFLQDCPQNCTQSHGIRWWTNLNAIFVEYVVSVLQPSKLGKTMLVICHDDGYRRGLSSLEQYCSIVYALEHVYNIFNSGKYNRYACMWADAFRQGMECTDSHIAHHTDHDNLSDSGRFDKSQQPSSWLQNLYQRIVSSDIVFLGSISAMALWILNNTLHGLQFLTYFGQEWMTNTCIRRCCYCFTQGLY